MTDNYNIKDILNNIICGDTLSELKKFPDNSIDTIITSPPYWGLRDYGVEGQIGLEKTLDEYFAKLLEITAELKRVLKPTGVMWWNHGDCYHSKPAGNKQYKYFQDGLYQRLGKRHTQGGTSDNTPKVLAGTEKCLALQNYRLIIKMIDEQGWISRSIVIWHKTNHMPSSVKDRLANSYEPVFMLVKNKKYWFDLDAIRVPATTKPWGKQTRLKGNYKWLKTDYFNYRVRDAEKKAKQCPQFKASEEEIEKYKRNKTLNEKYKVSGMKNPPEPGEPNAFNPLGKNPGDVWQLSTQPFPMNWCPKCKREVERKEVETNNISLVHKSCGAELESHFATFPEKLVEPMILSTCPSEICKKCGKARERITKTSYKPVEYIKGDKVYVYSPYRKYGKYKDRKEGSGKPQEMKRGIVKAEYQTIGWTDCGCNAGWEAGIVLDPFMGSGTVGVVAKRLKKNFIGIELNQEYRDMAMARINKVNQPML